jgi:hypothetical protein
MKLLTNAITVVCYCVGGKTNNTAAVSELEMQTANHNKI